jgi:hypothetical protein
MKALEEKTNNTLDHFSFGICVDGRYTSLLAYWTVCGLSLNPGLSFLLVSLLPFVVILAFACIYLG